MKLRDKVLMYRAKNKLTIRQFAELVGVTEMTISNIERGVQSPSRSTIAKIMLVIGGEDESKHIEN